MAKTFYPRKSVYVEASEPHPVGTAYKVSVGNEEWEGCFKLVVKVQLVVNGKIQGRKSPSYPIGTDDFKRVSEAIDTLMAIGENQR
ncbi:MAG: hypothetical protein MJ050_02400 [Phascolarctobacterium sp.]|nr:hypothetical protein [Phascolarctobacterium sp.]